MADIAFDVAEGYYLSAFTAKMILSGNVQSLQFSVNGAPPSISKYVAYDQLVPPNPFIAVTQDGNGNVVYDGGFPKFYNTSAPTAGINASISMEFSATCGTIAPGINAYYYNAFTTKNVTIAIGDKLVYDMFQDSVDARVGIDAITNADPAASTQYSLRDWGQATSTIRDQNGLSPHPATNLGTRAVNQWYHREFDLTACAGSTFVKWSMAYEGEVAGAFHTRFRDVYVIDKNGAIKATLFKDVIDLPNSSSTEAGSSGYTDLSKTLYDPRGQLTASFKYLYNAILWTANPKKLAAGNRKILILGDNIAGESYSVKGTAGTAFNTSFIRLCAAVGFTPTFVDRSDYVSAQIDMTLATMEQYACILIMSASHAAPITDACVAALVQYRQNGSGLIIITDDGPELTNISQAYPLPAVSRQFFAFANKIVVNFGAYFSGNYDRTPVNVGFLRSTYGDHPLYAGMLDSESIEAGGSESRVQVASYATVLPGAVQPFNIPSGKTIIQVTAILKSGEIIPFKITYNVVNFKLSFTDGVTVVDNGQQMNVGAKNQSLVNVALAGNPAINATGQVLKNGVKVGGIGLTAAGVLSQTWDGGGAGAVGVKAGDTFSVSIASPIVYTTTITINRFQPVLTGKRAMADIMKVFRDYKPALTPIKAMKTVVDEIASTVPWLGLKLVLNMPLNIKLIGDYFLDKGLASIVLPNAAMKAYATARPWAATGSYSLWQPPNPVTGTPIDFGYLCFSPVYGSESVPGNFKLDYYANVFIPAGSYRMFSQADDLFEFSMDGNLLISKGVQAQSDFVVAESRFYAIKVSNINTPANTPSYWTCAMVNMVTGAIVLRPEPGLWKTQEYAAT